MVTIILFTACSTAPQVDREYPFYNQTWKVKSADLANWLGVRVSAMAYNAAGDTLKGDTLYIEHDNVRDLKLYELTSQRNPGFIIEFTDSKIAVENRDVVPVDTIFSTAVYQWTEITRVADSSLVFKYFYTYQCNSTSISTDTLFLSLRNVHSGDTTKTYAFNIKGALESVNHIMCNN